MADEYGTKQVEVAGQIICELIRKDILPAELRTGKPIPASELAGVLGEMYQIIRKAIYTALESK